MQSAQAVCTAANTARDVPTAAIRLIPAASNPNGALVKNLFGIPRGTVTATECQLYRSMDTGTTLTFCDSSTMNAASVSNTAATPKTYFGPSSTIPYSDAAPLRLKPGEELWVAIGVALAAGVAFTAEFEAF